MKPPSYSRVTACLVAAFCVLLVTVSNTFAEDVKTVEREYPISLLAAKTSLQELGAYTGSRLPNLDGFIKTEGINLEQYQRPYYEFKIDLVPTAQDRTTVRVTAKISAWYAGTGDQPGYKVLETNGRLEGDLLDRLSEYLQKNPAPVVDPTALSQQIAEAHQQRIEAEQRVSALEQRTDQQTPAATEETFPEFANVVKPRAAVLSSPTERASVLIRAQLEDEFEVLEHRGTWLQVRVDDSKSGWIQQSWVRVARAVSATEPDHATSATGSLDGFTILRENTQPFSGDWISLHGKSARYIFVRPVGSSINSSPINKLRFAQAMFSERGRETLHISHSSVEGIVIVFLDQGGGVAAATLEDVRLWLSGTLTSPAFLKKCSLDPPSQFVEKAHPKL
ncbi:MAG: hypothetical protein NVS1B11_23990 [Terriglobales bacterium]